MCRVKVGSSIESCTESLDDIGEDDLTAIYDLAKKYEPRTRTAVADYPAISALSKRSQTSEKLAGSVTKQEPGCKKIREIAGLPHAARSNAEPGAAAVVPAAGSGKRKP